MNYPKDVLNIFFNALIGNSDALAWLHQNNYQELSAFVNGLYGIEKAENWLLNTSNKAWGYLSKAIKRDGDALVWLIDNGYTESAATAGMIHDDMTCEQWLLKNDHLTELKLGELLRTKF